MSAIQSFSQQIEMAKSEILAAILTQPNPIDFSDDAANHETITVNGNTGVWTNKAEEKNWSGPVDLNKYEICQDPNPIIIRKTPRQAVHFNQEITIRYLQPPTPPPPGDIIIIQEKPRPTPPAPPLVIRQQPSRSVTPPPLVVREAPPSPPKPIQPKVITIRGKQIPPPPRKVIVERLPQLPPKPTSVIVERWLAYTDQKRRVVYAKNQEPDPVVVKPKNVIVQWETPTVQVHKTFRDLGVIRANPVDYIQRFGNTLMNAYDMPQFVRDIRAPKGLVLANQCICNCAYYNSLEGDVSALKMIDLDKNGLGYLKPAIQKFELKQSSSIVN